MLRIDGLDFERELSGPQAYERYNEISKISQHRYLRLVFLQALVLCLIGLLGAFPYVIGVLEWTARIAMVALSLVLMALTFYQQHRNYMKGWQNARFVAESALSHAWLFAFRIGTYDNSEPNSTVSYLGAVNKIEAEVDTKQFLDLSTLQLPQITSWMKQMFNSSDIASKKAFYIGKRLDDQICWYTRKSAANRRWSTGLYIASLAMFFVGILATLLVPLYVFSILGFLSTITASVLTWRQTKRFDELKVTYSVAAKELSELKTRFELENDAPDILKFVEEAEKSISREHKLWFNWTYIS